MGIHMTKEKLKSKKAINGGLLVFAAVMLFNPNISMVDPLPDFIGYICIIAAISGIAEVVPYFAEARVAFMKLAVLTFTRIPAWIMTVSITSRAANQESLYTLFTFVYAVVELIFLIPALRTFFGGFSYLVERYGCRAALGAGSFDIGALKSLTLWMIIFKNLMGFLPDICYLDMYDYIGDVTRFDINWITVRPFFVVASVVLALAFGIVWLVAFIPYVRRVAGSPEIKSVATEAYKENANPINKKRTFRLVYAALTLVVIGSIFNVDITIDNMDIAPDFISALCYIAAILLIGKRYGHFVISLGFSAIYLVTSVLMFAVSASFFSEYEYEAIGKSVTAYEQYNLVKIASGLDSLALAITVAVIALLMLHVLREHTNFTKREYLGVRNRIIIFGVFGGINAVMSFLYTILMGITKEVGANGKYVSGGMVIFPKFEMFWIFVVVAGLAWMISALALSAGLKDGAEEKYIFL